MGAVEVEKILTIVPELLEIPYSRIWTSYDREADDSELTDDERGN